MEISDHFTDCSLMELWDLPATDATFLSDISLLNNNNAAQYPSCTNGSVGSVVLMNTTLTTATVAYYTGTAPGSRACFVCNNEGGYELTANERLCQSNSTWSGSPITCGMLVFCTHFTIALSANAGGSYIGFGPTNYFGQVDYNARQVDMLSLTFEIPDLFSFPY